MCVCLSEKHKKSKAMKTMKSFVMIMLGMAALMMVQSCRKDEEPQKPNFQRVARDNAIAQAAFDDLGNQTKIGVEEAEQETSGNKGLLGGLQNTCATITITPFDWTTFPKTIVIDFGNGCVGNDGKIRSGQITIHTTGWYRQEGTVITVSTDNYKVNGVLVQGTKTITNEGRNANQNLVYSLYINGTVTTPEGTISFESERQHEWIAGEPTLLNPWDDEYLITGWQKGQSTGGDQYEIIVLEPLHLKLNCPHLVAGKLKITIDGYQDDIYVDYGDGNCDNIAIITYMGQTYVIVMQ